MFWTLHKLCCGKLREVFGVFKDFLWRVYRQPRIKEKRWLVVVVELTYKQTNKLPNKHVTSVACVVFAVCKSRHSKCSWRSRWLAVVNTFVPNNVRERERESHCIVSWSSSSPYPWLLLHLASIYYKACGEWQFLYSCLHHCPDTRGDIICDLCMVSTWCHWIL